MSEQHKAGGPDGEPDAGTGPEFAADVIEDLDLPDPDADAIQGGRCAVAGRGGEITASQTMTNP